MFHFRDNLFSLAVMCGLVISVEGSSLLGAEPLGPLVDVMLQSGESRKGYLLAYSGGQMTIKLETGEVLTRDGAQVRTVRFIPAAPTAAPVVTPNMASAQETELTPSEVQKVFEFRRRQSKAVNKFTKEAVREMKELTKEEETEFFVLRAKLELHIKALEREIRLADDEKRAMNQLFDYARSQFQYGTVPDYVKPLVDKAADSIVNPVVKARIEARSKELSDLIEDRFKMKGPKKFN